MIGDKVRTTKKDVRRAKLLVPTLIKLPNKSIITIGGPSGTHKSELGEELQEQLYKANRTSILISLDDLYLTHYRDRVRIRRRKGIQYVGTKEIDWATLKAIIKSFKKGKDTLQVPLINKYTHSYNEETVYEVDKVHFLIIEGLYANYLKKWSMSSYAIHLEGTPQQTLAFRKKRNKEKETDLFRQRVVQREFNVVAQLKKYASKVISFED